VPPDTFSVVIPNWNGSSYLPACLDSIRAQTLRPAQVVVVDNASTDASAELVRGEYPETVLLALPRNLGFTGAVNAGIGQSRGAWIALLNQDAEAHPRWLEEMARVAAARPSAGAIACKILLADRRDHFHSAGDGYRVDGTGVNRGVWLRDEGQFEREEEVFGVCGGACAYRRAAVEQVGMLDQSFFMYYEDVDLAWRLQIAGWRAVYAPGAVVFHQLSSGAGATASFYSGRNAIWVLAKDVPSPLLRKYWKAMFGAQVTIARDAVRAWRGTAARARIRGQLVGLLTWPWMLGRRRAVQRSRRVPVSYLDGLLSRL
jgi:GT2 family glycosyltransferase